MVGAVAALGATHWREGSEEGHLALARFEGCPHLRGIARWYKHTLWTTLDALLGRAGLVQKPDWRGPYAGANEPRYSGLRTIWS